MKLFSLSALAFLILLSGCSPTNPSLSGGGNDFPNPPSSALGKIIAENLSKGDHWADSIALPAPSSPAAMAQSVSVPSAPSSGLAKKANTSLTVHFDLSDTSKGVVRVYISLDSDSAIKNDTFIVLHDDAYHDTIKNNEHLYLLKGNSTNKNTQIRTSYLFIDSDGDSIINNRDGKPNRVFASSSVTSPLGAITKFEIEIDAGKDGNLDTKADLRILQGQYLTLTQQGDTLSMVRYENYKGDSVVFDASSRDSFLVRVRLIDTDVLKRRTTAEAIFLIFPLDSAKNRPVYFRSAKSFNNGAVVKGLVIGPGSDSLFSGNDTAFAYIIVDSPDNVVSLDTLRMRVLTGKNPADLSSNSLVGLYIHRIKRTASDRETIVSLTCDQPIKAGEKLESGSFSLKILYADDRWITLDGTFTPTTITGQYEDSKGNSIELEWDRSGEPVQQ